MGDGEMNFMGGWNRELPLKTLKYTENSFCVFLCALWQ